MVQGDVNKKSVYSNNIFWSTHKLSYNRICLCNTHLQIFESVSMIFFCFTRAPEIWSKRAIPGTANIFKFGKWISRWPFHFHSLGVCCGVCCFQIKYYLRAVAIPFVFKVTPHEKKPGAFKLVEYGAHYGWQLRLISRLGKR